MTLLNQIIHISHILQEYTSSMRVMSHRDDWNAILDSAIGRPHCEFLMIERLRQVLFL